MADTITYIIMYGNVPLITSTYDLSNMAQAVKILHPKGGVAEPMAACSVTTIPKCMGSIPAIIADLKKIGVRITITIN